MERLEHTPGCAGLRGSTTCPACVLDRLVAEETIPHCDASVLHAPGECRYCDTRPDWQALRSLWGIAYTGHIPTAQQIACPSDFRRGFNQAARDWPGNRPAA